MEVGSGTNVGIDLAPMEPRSPTRKGAVTALINTSEQTG